MYSSGLWQCHSTYMILDVKLRVVFKIRPMESPADGGYPLFILWKLLSLAHGSLHIGTCQ